jgi:hypothetical protein
MNLLDVYNMREKGLMSEEEAAAAFGRTVRSLRVIWSRWGNKLPLMFSTLDKIREGKVSRAEAAELLEVSLRHVNQMMEAWGVQKPIGEKRVRREQADIKWSVRQKFAIDYIAGATTIEDAAEATQLSVRQMRRWVSQLLQKHYDMPFKDLKVIALARRRRLAQEIEEKEGLDLAKQQMLKAVFDGRKSIQEEAAERLAFARAHKANRTAHVRR